MAINKKIFNVDYKKLEMWLTPFDLRKSKLTAFLDALVSGVRHCYKDFRKYRKYIDYWLGITTQVCFMEKALNDKYDPLQRRIRIDDPFERLATPFFLKIENKPVTVYTKAEDNPLVLFTKKETSLFTVDFIVIVPLDLVFDETEMTAFVIYIKLVTRTFQIVRE
jgi:hypothetical protein